MPPPRPRTRRRLPRLLVGCAVSLALFLVLAEVALRLLPQPVPQLRQIENLRGFYQLDAAGRLEVAPNWSGSLTIDGRTTTLRTDAHGLRGPGTEPPAPGRPRVLVLGDSFVLGMGVEEQEAIPARLQQHLASRGVDAVVGNAGMWGTSPREWPHTLARHRATFAPDAVVAVCYAGNDPADLVAGPLTVVDGYPLDGATAHMVSQSWRWRLGLQWRTWWYLEMLVLLRRAPIQVAPRASLLPQGVSPFEGYFLEAGPQAESLAPWLAPFDDLFAGQLRALRTEAGPLPVLFVVLPGREASSPALHAAGVQRFLAGCGIPQDRAADFAAGNGSRRLARIATANDLQTLDLTDRVLSQPDVDALYLSDYHYNATGCDRVAHWIADEAHKVLAR
ncbi:MAG: hypothetical protein RL148_877 [Planctomycetota bacterium]